MSTEILSASPPFSPTSSPPMPGLPSTRSKSRFRPGSLLRRRTPETAPSAPSAAPAAPAAFAAPAAPVPAVASVLSLDSEDENGAGVLAPRVRAHSSGALAPVSRAGRPQLAFRPLSPILSPGLFAESPSPGETGAGALDYLSHGLTRAAPHANTLPPGAAPPMTPATRPVSLRRSTMPESGSAEHVLEAGPPAPMPSAVPRSASGRRPHLFHIPSGTVDDDEDDDDDDDDDDALSPTPSRKPSRVDLGGRPAEPPPVASPIAADERDKGHVRQFHALMELLTTEAGYVHDLRILVSVYLDNLDTVAPRVPTSSYSFGGHARSLSASKTPVSTSALTPIFQSEAIANSKEQDKDFAKDAKEKEREKDKDAARRLFSPRDVDTVRSNAAALLAVHETFAGALRAAVVSCGLPPASLVPTDAPLLPPTATEVQRAVDAVAMTFIKTAPSFDLYQAYAARQPEAQDVVRRVQKAHPSEWTAFEQRCALAAQRCSAPVPLGESAPALSSAVADVADASAPARVSAQISRSRPTSPTEADRVAASRRARRHSLSTVTTLVGLRSTGDASAAPAAAPTPVAATPPAALTPRLLFLDYLIKPVQRICRYPLLLDALRASTPGAPADALLRRRPSTGSFAVLGASVRAPAENAAQVLRGVVAAVDDARRIRDGLARSARIAARLAAPAGARGPGPAFVSSLGPCALAGVLDVAYTHVARPLAPGDVLPVKYCGAFLYSGGYMLVCKAHKSRAYEPRYWFPLGKCDVVDLGDAEADLPCTIRITCYGHQLDLMASCQREKDVWMAAIHEALESAPEWVDEPYSSLQYLVDGKSLAAVRGPDEPPAKAPPLLADQATDTFSGSAEDGSPVEPRSAVSESGHGAVRPASRRSSTLFSGLSSSGPNTPASGGPLYVRRPSAHGRQAVERALADVLAPAVLAARFQAQTHDEELWPGPRRPGGFTRSNSALAMLAAKDRFTHRDTLVLRRGPSAGSTDAPAPESSAEAARRPAPHRVPSSRRNPRSLMITPISAGDAPGDALDAAAGPDTCAVPDSPELASQCSSVNMGVLPVSLAPPLLMPMSAALPLLPSFGAPRRPTHLAPEPDTRDTRPKRTRSLVDNVKGMFASRGASPVAPRAVNVPLRATAASTPTPPPSVVVFEPEAPSAADGAAAAAARLKWWQGSLRRRVRSAPESPPSSPAGTLSAAPTSLPSTHGRRTSLSSTPEGKVLDVHAAAAVPPDASKPTRRRSVFVRRQTEPPVESTGETPASSRVVRRQSVKLLFSSSRPER